MIPWKCPKCGSESIENILSLRTNEDDSLDKHHIWCCLDCGYAQKTQMSFIKAYEKAHPNFREEICVNCHIFRKGFGARKGGINGKCQEYYKGLKK